MDDHELLREYIRSRSQEAFRQLVDRHLAMVLSAAQRLVGDAHLAEEVAQGVTITSILLATALAASTTTAVPVGLSAAITASALAGTAAAATTATHAALMTMFNAKAVAALIGAAVITGAVTYLIQQHQVQRLQADNQSLLAQQAQASAEQEAAAKAAQATKEQLERLQKDNAELLQLRNEVGQLRRERDALKQRASQPAAGAGQSASNPGRYVSKEQLAFAGYATPEAALESMTWAVMKGAYDQFLAGLAPGLLKDGSQQTREQFGADRQDKEAVFKGMQIVARKALDEDRVELKVKIDADLGGQGIAPPIVIVRAVKVGNEWKMDDLGRTYQPEWDKTGQIQSFAQ